jgi:hypothetical protein
MIALGELCRLIERFFVIDPKTDDLWTLRFMSAMRLK